MADDGERRLRVSDGWIWLRPRRMTLKISLLYVVVVAWFMWTSGSLLFPTETPTDLLPAAVLLVAPPWVNLLGNVLGLKFSGGSVREARVFLRGGAVTRSWGDSRGPSALGGIVMSVVWAVAVVIVQIRGWSMDPFSSLSLSAAWYAVAVAVVQLVPLVPYDGAAVAIAFLRRGGRRTDSEAVVWLARLAATLGKYAWWGAVALVVGSYVIPTSTVPFSVTGLIFLLLLLSQGRVENDRTARSSGYNVVMESHPASAISYSPAVLAPSMNRSEALQAAADSPQRSVFLVSNHPDEPTEYVTREGLEEIVESVSEIARPLSEIPQFDPEESLMDVYVASEAVGLWRLTDRIDAFAWHEVYAWLSDDRTRA